MSGLDDIQVRVEASGFIAEDVLTGMADAVLREIHQHLQALHESDTAHIIDLRSLPLTEADRRQLKATLGEGEVQIQIEAAGPTEIYETSYAGVWWVDYQNLLGASAIQQVEIARVPTLVPSHPDDVKQALARLGASLAPGTADTDT